MADRKSKDLRARRNELSDSLPDLNQKRDRTYRLNSDAIALDRAGVTDHTPLEMTRLGDEEIGANTALREAQLEMQRLDAEIKGASGLGTRFGRVLRRR